MEVSRPLSHEELGELVSRDLNVDIEVRVPEVENAWEYEVFESPTDFSSDTPSVVSLAQSRRRRKAPPWSSSRVQDLDPSEDELASTTSILSRRNGHRRVNGRPRVPENYDSESTFSESSTNDSGVITSRPRMYERPGRPQPSRGNRKPEYREMWSLDDSEEDTVLGKRKRGQGSRSARPKNEALRYSERPRRSHYMREYQHDEIEQGHEKQSGPSKAVGAREWFLELAVNNSFRVSHNQTCHTCEEYGDSEERGILVFCQGCTFSYHRRCLGNRSTRDHLVTKVGEQGFILQCRQCIEVAVSKNPSASRQGHCQKCQELGTMSNALRKRQTSKEEQIARDENNGEDPITEVPREMINQKLNVMFRCIFCYRAFHMHHLSNQAGPGPVNPSIAQDTQDAHTNMNEENLFDIILSEYRRTWACEQCSSSPAEVDALVAWRPADAKSHHSQDLEYNKFEEDKKEYLIKWKGLSYSQCIWMPGSWVWGIVSPMMRKTFAKRELPAKHSFEDAVPEEYLRIDIILDIQYTSVVKVRQASVDKARVKEVEKVLVKFKGLGYEDAAWEKPPLEDEPDRWSDYTLAYDDWVLGRHTHLPKAYPLRIHLEKIRSQNFEAVELSTQPANLTGGKLMEYQIEGLNWLYYKWYSLQNAILADEMGLGKTVQIIGLLATLQHRHGCWPFLVVVPNSTCPNWRREIKQWAPSLRVVTYFGSAEAKRLAAKHELFPDGSKDLHCHVVVTSYDAAEDANFRTMFRGVPWAGLVVDEGQRLKSDRNILYTVLSSLNVPFKVLLTGTPLQNNQRELFNLLQFLDRFVDAAALEEEYKDLNREAIIEIHSLLRPFFLRRTKAQVLKHLPPMAQIIIPVTMTVVQKKLYKSILAKNQGLIRTILGGQKIKQADNPSLNNILMQLRKCLCHPFVYNREIEERTDNLVISHQNLVGASAKLRLLEIMLPKLQELGHRVLIFSQFLDMLNIVEDFLDSLGMFYQRLDGSMNSLQKQKRIDAFNAPGSSLFAFLLSTRAGGVGINLATADTVIILDPDFNPHQDMQALSRAHRIGQEKKVLVFQLITRDSVEEKIMQIGKKKMSLDHVLIDQMEEEEGNNVDLESILRHGAEALFQDEVSDILYDSVSVDKLLERSSQEDTGIGQNASADTQFSFARVWANDKGDMGGNLGDESTDRRPIDPSLWDKILKEREEEVALEATTRAETFGRGKRRKTNVDYTRDTEDQSLYPDSSPMRPHRGKKVKDGSESDTEFQARPETPETDDFASDPEHQGPRRSPHSNTRNTDQPVPKRAFRRVEVPETHDKPSNRALNLLPTSLQTTSTNISTPILTSSRHTATAPSQMDSHTQPNTLLPHGVPCVACDARHSVGYCPLKLAGVEFCGLCGLAHFGYARTCPHLTSMTQCRQMLESLRRSQEAPHLIEMARKYLVGVIGDLRRKKKEEDSKTERGAPVELSNGSSTVALLRGEKMDAQAVIERGLVDQEKSVYFDEKGNLYTPEPQIHTNGFRTKEGIGEPNGSGVTPDETHEGN